MKNSPKLEEIERIAEKILLQCLAKYLKIEQLLGRQPKQFLFSIDNLILSSLLCFE